MFFLYEALLFLVLLVASPWFLVIGLIRGKYLPTLRERFGGYRGEPEQTDLWVHAVSVGEVMAARTIVREVQKLRPGLSIIVTTTTMTGQAMAAKLFPECRVAYFPFDFSFSVKRFLDRFGPRAHVVVETEIWPNVIRHCRRRGIPLALVNGRISDRSFGRYARLRFLFGPLLSEFAALVVREEMDRERLIAMGAPPAAVEVAGNVKFDFEIGSAPLEIEPDVRRLAGNRPIIVLGSIVEGEDALVAGQLRQIIDSGCFVVLAPRKPERFDAVARLVESNGIRMARRSTIAVAPAETDLLLLDSIGELARLYKLASLAFVGGSLVPTGGHNPIEPAAAGVPVAFGPHMSNFREIAQVFLDGGGAIEVATAERLTALIDELLHDDAARAARAEKAKRVIEANRGAAAKMARRIAEMLG